MIPQLSLSSLDVTSRPRPFGKSIGMASKTSRRLLSFRNPRAWTLTPPDANRAGLRSGRPSPVRSTTESYNRRTPVDKLSGTCSRRTAVVESAATVAGGSTGTSTGNELDILGPSRRPITGSQTRTESVHQAHDGKIELQRERRECEHPGGGLERRLDRTSERRERPENDWLMTLAVMSQHTQCRTLGWRGDAALPSTAC